MRAGSRPVPVSAHRGSSDACTCMTVEEFPSLFLSESAPIPFAIQPRRFCCVGVGYEALAFCFLDETGVQGVCVSGDLRSTSRHPSRKPPPCSCLCVSSINYRCPLLPLDQVGPPRHILPRVLVCDQRNVLVCCR